MRRYRDLSEKARRLRVERPDYPDDPKQAEELRLIAEALREPQMRAIAAMTAEYEA